MNYTRNDFHILRTIYKNECKSEIKSMTIKEIQEKTNLSCVKIRATLNSFLKDEFINEGIKKINAKAYYITENGMNRLREIRGGKNNEKDI